MQVCIPGQRWISDSELQLGLGTVLQADSRSVTLEFPASGETRTYALQSAPLSRVRFAAGDHIVSHLDEVLLVESTQEEAGLLRYYGIDEQGQARSMHETELNNFLQLNQPGERLFNGQIDKPNWFEFRQQTLSRQQSLSQSPLFGLQGCRTSLIPHQLYIAHEVAKRFAPRVLLADEVGLGKTIEAGLILHQQWLSGRVNRVLCLVPESLIHQWLVEMLRRFNLAFSVFDAERLLAMQENGDQQNPFHTEQLVLCSQEFLQGSQGYFKQALAGDWDLLVVDEAHHLQWSEQEASPEYLMVEQLARQTPGVLLLTATPEQLGRASHFARLRLLDPDRFHDLQNFLAEEQAYTPIAEAMQVLLADTAADNQALAALSGLFQETDNIELLQELEHADAERSRQIRQQLVDHLLDRHGTGRVLFRNTRSSMQGFPTRHVHSYPLACPSAYLELRSADAAGIAAQLWPERHYAQHRPEHAPGWLELDPRIPWLQGQLQDLATEKVLLITAHASSVLDLAACLKDRQGIHAAVFHEGMSLVKRDRAAAHFADRETGSQLMICSEIGSEGRNFQFAHHLVLFDLPLHPDLLEQRIGRLDRIGQNHSIHIHVPYLESTGQETLFRWYHEGLQAFEQTCPVGSAVYSQLGADLARCLPPGGQDCSGLLQRAATLTARLLDALHRGRDQLLEYNSCRPYLARQLVEQAELQDHDKQLATYLELACDCLDIQYELLKPGSYLLRPGEHMLYSLPGLPEDGLRCTYHRHMALANEDLQFLTWEHPLLLDLMDSVLSSETGNTSVVSLPERRLDPGTILLECLFRLDTPGKRQLQIERYLPAASIRTLLDEKGRDLAAALPPADIRRHHEPVDPDLARQAVKMKQSVLRGLLKRSEQWAQERSQAITDQARAEARRSVAEEINRLRALQKVNPSIRAEEIQHFTEMDQALESALQNAHLRLDALRVIVITD